MPSEIDLSILKKELSFGISGLLLQTAVFFINSADKFFVMAFFGREQTGLYSVAGTFASVQFIICVAFMQYLQPVIFKKFAAGEQWSALKAVYKKYLLGMFGSLLLVLAGGTVAYFLLLKESYQQHIHYFFILSFSSFLWCITNLLVQNIIFSKNKRVIIKLALWSILLASFINFETVKFFSVTQLCIAQVVINAIVLAITLYFNKKLNFFR
ncbi:MAG: oligosaccharide flippase family protein [Ferruginibacter sp.]